MKNSAPMTRRQCLALGSAAWLALGLSACALPKPYAPLQEGVWRGRMALHTEEDPPQSHVATFELRGHAQAGALDVFTPLGSILARLHWDARQAVLETGSETHTGQTLDELAQRIFGAPIPIAALFAWLSGRAQPEPGWLVDLSRYDQGRIFAVRQQPLPRATLRVILQSDTA